MKVLFLTLLNHFLVVSKMLKIVLMLMMRDPVDQMSEDKTGQREGVVSRMMDVKVGDRRRGKMM